MSAAVATLCHDAVMTPADGKLEKKVIYHQI